MAPSTFLPSRDLSRLTDATVRACVFVHKFTLRIFPAHPPHRNFSTLENDDDDDDDGTRNGRKKNKCITAVIYERGTAIPRLFSVMNKY